jgi:hypothetical protein
MKTTFLTGDKADGHAQKKKREERLTPKKSCFLTGDTTGACPKAHVGRGQYQPTVLRNMQ